MMLGARTAAWAKRESIPSGWVAVEYVQSNGDGSYIDTGIRGEKGLPLSVEFSKAKESIDLFRVFGSRSSASSNGFAAGTYSGYSNSHIVINYGTKSFFFDGNIKVSTDRVYRIETDETSIRCYTDGKFAYTSLAELTDFLVGHMANENWLPEQARAYFEAQLPKLNYWQRHG